MQLSLFDIPEPLVTTEEATRALDDLKYGCQIALQAAVDLLTAVRKTNRGCASVSLADGIERLLDMRYSDQINPQVDCRVWYEFIAYHPVVVFGADLPSRRPYQRAEVLLTAVHQAAHGYMREARVTIGLDEWTDKDDADDAK